MLNLKNLKENQRIKAIFTPDIAFSTFQMFVFDKATDSFLMEGGEDYAYPVEIVVNDSAWQLFLVTYSEPFRPSDWNWKRENRESNELEYVVEPLNKERVQLV